MTAQREFYELAVHVGALLDIRASMDVTIAFNGAARGVICCAQQGAPRHWSRQEPVLLKRCAAEISLRRADVAMVVRLWRSGASSHR